MIIDEQEARWQALIERGVFSLEAAEAIDKAIRNNFLEEEGEIILTVENGRVTCVAVVVWRLEIPNFSEQEEHPS